jgi:hypothetical protein
MTMLTVTLSVNRFIPGRRPAQPPIKPPCVVD